MRGVGLELGGPGRGLTVVLLGVAGLALLGVAGLALLGVAGLALLGVAGLALLAVAGRRLLIVALRAGLDVLVVAQRAVGLLVVALAVGLGRLVVSRAAVGLVGPGSGLLPVAGVAVWRRAVVQLTAGGGLIGRAGPLAAGAAPGPE